MVSKKPLVHGLSVLPRHFLTMGLRPLYPILTYLLLYVDDIVLTGNDVSYIDHLITQLKTQFDMTDLGSLSYFIGLEIK